MNRFISDLHFGHANILTFDRRPYADVEQMENALVANWNGAVDSTDTTYILGDFCWSPKDHEWCRLLDLLQGNKVLVRGNHDLKQMSTILKNKFADIKDYKEITCEQRHVIMCHYPIMMYKGNYDPKTYMLCGHVHITHENEYLVKWRTEIRQNRNHSFDSYGNIYNVGCMLPYMNYTPRTLDEIITGSEHEQLGLK